MANKEKFTAAKITLIQATAANKRTTMTFNAMFVT